MNMKGHILAALREQLEAWNNLLARLTEEQIISPAFDFDWSIKDVIAHLWAWQQISTARLEAGLLDREPDYPQWIVKHVESWEEHADEVNALTFETYHNRPWSEIHKMWKTGFSHLLELGNQISERDLLDGDRYSWLKGYSLATILVASYEHHQEHLEKLRDWLNED
jgi:hypothetical protein